jgi:hypothetical protein
MASCLSLFLSTVGKLQLSKGSMALKKLKQTKPENSGEKQSWFATGVWYRAGGHSFQCRVVDSSCERLIFRRFLSPSLAWDKHWMTCGKKQISNGNPGHLWRHYQGRLKAQLCEKLMKNRWSLTIKHSLLPLPHLATNHGKL